MDRDAFHKGSKLAAKNIGSLVLLTKPYLSHPLEGEDEQTIWDMF